MIASSNKKIAASKEFQCDEDYDSDRETINGHKKKALNDLAEQIYKFNTKDSSAQVKNLQEKKLYVDFPNISKQYKPKQRKLEHSKNRNWKSLGQIKSKALQSEL